MAISVENRKKNFQPVVFCATAKGAGSDLPGGLGFNRPNEFFDPESPSI